MYYDPEDNETHLVRIMPLDNKPHAGIQIAASSMYKNNSMGQANMCVRIMFICSSNGSTTTKKEAESMHPILRKYGVYILEQYEPENYHCYVVGHAPKFHRNWSVVHVSDGFSEDVREENAIWRLSHVPKNSRSQFLCI